MSLSTASPTEIFCTGTRHTHTHTLYLSSALGIFIVRRKNNDKNKNKKLFYFCFVFGASLLFIYFVPLFLKSNSRHKKSVSFTCHSQTNLREHQKNFTKAVVVVDVKLILLSFTDSVPVSVVKNYYCLRTQQQQRAHPFTSNLNDRIDCVLHSWHTATPRMAYTRTKMPVGRRQFENVSGAHRRLGKCARVKGTKRAHEKRNV